jgi:hypothetical protein
LLLLLTLAACQGTPEPEESTPSPRSPLATQPVTVGLHEGAELHGYKLYWPKRAPAEALTRAQTVAQLLAGKELRVDASRGSLGERWAAPFHDETVHARYVPAYDDLRVRMVDATSQQRGEDIGEARARTLAVQLLDELHANGVVNKHDFDLSSAQAAHAHAATGGADGEEENWITEYRFRAMRSLNGIPVANAGIVIGITPQGQRSSLRVGGVEAEVVRDGPRTRPGPSGGIQVQRVALEALEPRLHQELQVSGRKHVSFRQVMYVMPPDVDEAVVTPRQIFKYSVVSDGGGVVSRAQHVALSLTEPRRPIEMIEMQPRSHKAR